MTIDKNNAKPLPLTNSTDLNKQPSVNKRHIADLLPDVHKTELIRKFFKNTGDHLFQPEQSEQLSGFIGRIPTYANLGTDFYIHEPTKERKQYQLDPIAISIDDETGEITQTLFYEDIVNLLRFQGGIVENHDRLFNTLSYSWAPPITFDKFLNYQNYFWIPDESGTTNANLTSTTPDYMVMEVGANNGNPWSVRNRWKHIDDLTNADKDIAIKANRPIIEFRKNLELYNYGTIRRNPVTVKDDITTNPKLDIVGSTSPIIIDGVTLQDGDTILFTNDQIPVLGSWDLSSWDLENTPNGIWDEFVGIYYSAQASNITLKINTGNGNGIIFSNTANFISLGFQSGMNVHIQGSTQDGQYIVENVTTDSIFLSSAFPSLSSDQVQLNNVTVLEIPANYKDRVFEINGIGTGVTLTPVIDGNIDSGAPGDGDIVLIIDGDINGSKEFYWNINNSEWMEAQTKQFRNIPPLFQLYDTNGVKLQDEGVYPNSSFNGNKIFNYNINSNLNQTIDSSLDIRLTYDQYGEFQFENFLVTDRVYFNVPNEEIKGFYFHKREDNYSNDWHIRDTISKQYVIEDISINENQFDYTLSLTPDTVDDITIYYQASIIDSSQYIISGSTITLINELETNNTIRVRYYSSQTPAIDDNVVYEIPSNLEDNPNNYDVDITSRSKFFEHFSEIISNQAGIDGNPNGINNYRTLTNIDYSLGNQVLQHKASMLKLMAISSSSTTDFMKSIRFVEREFSRFRNKFIKKIETFSNSTFYNKTENKDVDIWIENAINEINLGKNETFPFAYSNMIQMENDNFSYIPSSPSRLGVYPVFKPEVYLDRTYSPAYPVIQMHDGSIMLTFNDFRDDVLLALETRIYDNIPDEYKTEIRPDFDYTDFVSAQYRSGEYSINEFNKLLTPIISRWASFNGIDIYTNDIYDSNDPFTYNYNSLGLPGHWRGIYKLYYDTDRPNTHPWEMFGFSEQPSWWLNRYGPRPYNFNNPILWNDMRNGYIAFGDRQGYHQKYARPNAPIPVNAEGKLLDPITLGITIKPGEANASANWKIGDHGPAETVFRRSEFWSYAIAQISYLMKPAQFIDIGWDSKLLLNVYENSNDPQWINDLYHRRSQTLEEFVHGEEYTDGTIFISDGIQQWISDWIISNGKSIKTSFGDIIRGIDVRLGHKMAGFISTANNQYLADNLSGPIPDEDVNVLLYKNPSIREEFYGGVIIERVHDGWSISGYDALNGEFLIYPGITTGKKIKINVGSFNVVEYKEFNLDALISVPYGTVFKTYQDVYNFLIGYGVFLESRGWVFDDYQSDENETRNWRLSGKQFLFWAQGNWSDGSLIALSPLSQKVKFKTEHGEIQSLEQVINGVYSLLNRDGAVLQPRDVFVTRDSDEIIITPEENQTIYAARLFIAENEHVLVFNNTTIFNDLIYDQLYGLRQARLRIFTTRALGWKGRIDAPGYFVTDNTLTPNFEKTVNDFRKFFEIEDQVNRPGPQSAAQRNVGFQERDYLSSMLISPLTQFDFYRGFIKSKGTPSVLSTLLRSDIASGSDDIKFFEEWAFKLGDYGATSDFSSAELKLYSDQLTGNPQLIEFTASELRESINDLSNSIILYNATDFPSQGIITVDNELIRYKNKNGNELQNIIRGINNTAIVDHESGTSVGIYDNLYDDTILISPYDERWNVRPEDNGIAVFKLRDTEKLYNTIEVKRNPNGAYYQRNDNRVAGYPLESEVKYRVGTINARNTLITGILNGNNTTNTVELGDQIWVDNIQNYYSRSSAQYIFNYGFQVFNIIEDTSISLNGINTLAEAEGDPITLDITGTWNIGDVIIIGDTVGTEPSLNGVHTVIGLDGARPVIEISITDDTNLDLTNVILYKFTEARFINFSDIDDNNFSFNNDVYRFAYVDTSESIMNPFPLWKVYTANSIGSWEIARTQNVLTDSRSFKESLIYNNKNNTIDLRIDIFDPAKGLYPGQSISEIDFKLEYDPAKYNKGDNTRFQLDNEQAWGDLQVGNVWWDLSTLEYENYETGTNRERRNKWGRLAPGKSIDVYEWVRSPVPPSQWAALVNSTKDQPEENFSYKPSGSAYYGSDQNGPYVERRVINTRTGREQVNYYFWVKQSNTIPNLNNRSRPVSRIARELSNPTAAGLPWFAPINDNALIISNIQSVLTSTDSILQINYNFELNKNNSHIEWELIKEGSSENSISDRLWTKMRDSLTGINYIRQAVPDPNLEESRKYGNLIRPRQGWFIDNSQAAKIFVEKLNDLIRNVCILDKEGVLDSLSVKSTQPTPYGSQLALQRLIEPNEFNDPFDLESDSDISSTSQYHVPDLSERNNLLITGQATLGQQIYVDGVPSNRGFWTIYKVINENPGNNINDAFEIVSSEAFRLEDFWYTIDFYEDGFDENTVYDYEVENLSARDSLSNVQIGDIVYVTDTIGDGTNIWSIYQRVSYDNFDYWELVGKEQCSVQFNVDLFFDDDYGNNSVVDSSVDYPDGVPGRILALESLINSLRNIILTDEQENIIFFSMVNYVHSEQLLLDWVFKTTYISSLGLNRNISQDPIFVQDRAENFINFIEEAKPYHVKLREFTIQENFGVDVFSGNVTDFDKPIYWDENMEEFRVLDPNNNSDIEILSDPSGDYYDWYENYLDNPELIRQFKMKIVFDRTSCDTNGGWDPIFGWDNEANESWDLETPAILNAADRIVNSYISKPIIQNDVISQNITETLDINTLISGCDFKAIIIDNGMHTDLLQTTIGGWSDIDDSPWGLIPWSPLGGTSNVIDISDYDVIYDGGQSNFKSITQDVGTGSNTTFNINNFVSGDVISVFVDDNIQILNDDYTIVGTSVEFTVPPANGSIIKISVYESSFDEASVDAISDIIVDGNLFKQPYIDNNHPEELILGSIGESVSIKVNDNSPSGGDFRLFLNNINSIDSNNNKPILRTNLDTDLLSTSTTLTLSSTVGFNSGILLIETVDNLNNTNIEHVMARGPETIDKKYLAYNANGNTINLPGPISIESQIYVSKRDTKDGPELQLIINVDYTLDINNNELTFINAPTLQQFLKVRIIYKINNTFYNVRRGYNNTIAKAAASNDSIVIANTTDNSKTIAVWDDYRIIGSDTTTLAQPLNIGDTTIELTSVAGLPKQKPGEARMVEPGVIWIGNERIEFFKREGTVLHQVVRGTSGTSNGIYDIYDSMNRLISDYKSTILYYDTLNSVILSNSNGNGEITSNEYDFTQYNLIPGQVIRFYDNTDNNGKYTIVSVSNNTIIVDEEFSGPIGPRGEIVKITLPKSGNHVIPAGTEVINGSKKHKIPNGYEWFESNNGLAQNDTHQKAKFINGLS